MTVALAAALVAQGAATARAQYSYPPGYGGYGWGGWGSQAGTVGGDVARGMGAFAAGAGVYNQETAVARSINADTAMKWNNYIYANYAEAERRRQNRVVANRRDRERALAEIRKRLRDNPTESDVNSGDAMNAALVEVSNPKIYLRGLSVSAAQVPGTVIRDIPFQQASMAITASVAGLARDSAPKAFRENEAFASGRAELRRLREQFDKEDEEGKPSTDTIEQARATVKALQAKSAETFPEGSRDRREVDNYLKALMGLLRMLETPAINVLLSGVDKRPDTTLGDLINFMKAFNLRFGVAKTPEQRAAYQQVYPLLAKLRDEAAQGNATVAAAKKQENMEKAPAEFFSQMEFEHLGPRKAPMPPPPAPRPKP